MAQLLDSNGNPVVTVEASEPEAGQVDVTKTDINIPEIPSAEGQPEGPIMIHISEKYAKVIARAMNMILAVAPTLCSHRREDRINHDRRVDQIMKLCEAVREEVINNAEKPINKAEAK